VVQNTKLSKRGKIYSSIIETVGKTPLVSLNRYPKEAGCVADIIVKLEFFNPMSSVKDRIGIAMIEAAEAAGKAVAGKTLLVEPTSGNTGIALAFVCAAKGYKLILTMPESMSLERQKLLKLLGAEIHLTPAVEGMSGALKQAEQIVQDNSDALMLQQFANHANPEIHRATTAEEIWEDCAGELDVLVCGIGTGGTITGCSQFLKPRLPNLRVIGVEPEDSPVLSGGIPGPHKIQGIGAGFIPEVLDSTLINEIISVGNETAFETARKVARLDGIPVGISSGAALAAAIEIGCESEMFGKRIVVIIPSFAERYLSTDLFVGI